MRTRRRIVGIAMACAAACAACSSAAVENEVTTIEDRTARAATESVEADATEADDFYEDPSSRRVHIIPWDLDNTLQGWTSDDLNPVTAIPDAFGETRNGCKPFLFGPFNLSQRSAGCDPLVAAWALLDDEFERIDRQFRNGPFAIDAVAGHVEAWREQIAPFVAEAAALHDDALDVVVWNASVDQLLADIAAEPSRQES